MTSVRTLFSDKWGDILDRPDNQCVEILWHATTAEMGEEDFRVFLEKYADCVEACGRPGGLIDALQFGMDTSKLTPGWRDENIIPRYNSAGMKKFAFIVPEGMPAIGTAPATEGPANFPTGYYGNRSDALDWLRD
ncbi:MAG: hypothetical protein HQ511_06750 [Rhodospirillales bacterium]|nr:hypothetical protein [Rhodospirillales bacterium]